jgi:hypothetical protein
MSGSLQFLLLQLCEIDQEASPFIVTCGGFVLEQFFAWSLTMSTNCCTQSVEFHFQGLIPVTYDLHACLIKRL